MDLISGLKKIKSADFYFKILRDFTQECLPINKITLLLQLQRCATQINENSNPYESVWKRGITNYKINQALWGGVTAITKLLQLRYFESGTRPGNNFNSPYSGLHYDHAAPLVEVASPMVEKLSYKGEGSEVRDRYASPHLRSNIVPELSKAERILKFSREGHTSLEAVGKEARATRNNEGKLGAYLAGLIESDGTIIVPDLDNSTTPTIKIVFNIKDKPLAVHIKSVLGYGSIQKTQSGNAVELVISNKTGILDLIITINGKFRTPKIFKLHKLIDWINISPKYTKLNTNLIIKLPLDVSNLNSNSWLAGFSEGDASFQIRTTIGPKYNHISTTYELCQSRLDSILFEDYKPIMESIANLFLANLGITHLMKYDRSCKQKAWRVRNTSQAGAAEVVNYFIKYPLYSSKHLDFLSWREAHYLIINNAHYKNSELDGLNRIGILKISMNDNRSHFTWNHLSNFYTK